MTAHRSGDGRMRSTDKRDKRDVTRAQWPSNRRGQGGAKTHMRDGRSGTFRRRDTAIILNIVDFSAHGAYIS